MSECEHRYFPCVCESRDPSDCTCPDTAACRIREGYCEHPDTDEQECWRYQEHRAEAAETDAERLAAGLRWWACGQAKHISGGPPTLGCNCNACDALRTHDDLKKIGS